MNEAFRGRAVRDHGNQEEIFPWATLSRWNAHRVLSKFHLIVFLRHISTVVKPETYVVGCTTLFVFSPDYKCLFSVCTRDTNFFAFFFLSLSHYESVFPRLRCPTPRPAAASFHSDLVASRDILLLGSSSP